MNRDFFEQCKTAIDNSDYTDCVKYVYDDQNIEKFKHICGLIESICNQYDADNVSISVRSAQELKIQIEFMGITDDTVMNDIHPLFDLLQIIHGHVSFIYNDDDSFHMEFNILDTL